MKKFLKYLFILLLILGVFVLAGWGKKSVELMIGNEQYLINLHEAIKEASIGKEGNTKTVDGDETESDENNIGSQTVSISAEFERRARGEKSSIRNYDQRYYGQVLK